MNVIKSLEDGRCWGKFPARREREGGRERREKGIEGRCSRSRQKLNGVRKKRVQMDGRDQREEVRLDKLKGGQRVHV